MLLIKSLNFLNNLLAKLDAIACGVDECLMLDENESVAEACAENIFGVKHGKLSKPHPTAAISGITRAAVIEIARHMNYDEKDITYQELYSADE